MRSMRTKILGVVASSLLAAAGVLSSIGAAIAADKTIRIALQPAPLLGFYVKDKQLLDERYARGDAPWELWKGTSQGANGNGIVESPRPPVERRLAPVAIAPR